MLEHPSVKRVLIAVSASMLEHAQQLMQPFGERVVVLVGGSERQHSIARCLEDPACAQADLIMVHDAVRPFADIALLNRVAEAASTHGAAVPAIPVSDTIKRVDDRGGIVSTPPRAELRAIQTPQAFLRDVVRHAYAVASANGTVGTDDASLVEAFGGNVVTVPGSVTNIKITTPIDLAIAHLLLQHHDLD
jgi:2-C-methyl-D-erythritol 4-phosphate cytidylyltransferase